MGASSGDEKDASWAKGKSEQRRGGREQTTAAILDAAEKLFAERGFTAVTVRDIAAEAGVSHALVHRYLGSKQDVYRAMLVRNEDAIRSAASEDDELLDGDEPDVAGGAGPSASLRASHRALGAARPLV